jgi:hypothetical protein
MFLQSIAELGLLRTTPSIDPGRLQLFGAVKLLKIGHNKRKM